MFTLAEYATCCCCNEMNMFVTRNLSIKGSIASQHTPFFRMTASLRPVVFVSLGVPSLGGLVGCFGGSCVCY